MKTIKKTYESPRILKAFVFDGGVAILAGSVVNNLTGVQTTGQELDNHDFNAGGFSTNWGE